MDAAKKQNIISRVQSNRQAHQNAVRHDLEYKISVFQSKIREGPYYICFVCNRLLYRKTVIQLKKQAYNTAEKQSLFTDIKSFDDKHYICRTCHTNVLKGKIPCQAVCNKLCVDDVPPELSVLEKLEQILTHWGRLPLEMCHFRLTTFFQDGGFYDRKGQWVIKSLKK